MRNMILQIFLNPWLQQAHDYTSCRPSTLQQTTTLTPTPILVRSLVCMLLAVHACC